METKKRADKKGLSTIVATLIVILLVFVAVGILWVVLRNFVQGGSDQVDLASDCMEVTVELTKVVPSSGGVYNVTLYRTGGDFEIGGVNLVFTGADGESNYIADSQGDIQVLGLKKVSVNLTDSGVENPNRVDAIVYFLGDSGEKLYCSTGETLTF
jgi:flagellin-like protein